MRLAKIAGPLPAMFLSLLALALIGYLDYVTGNIGFQLFYLIPVVATTWFGGKKTGIIMCILTTGLWLANYLTERGYGGVAITIWESVVILGVFVLVSLLLSYLKTARGRLEKSVASLSSLSAELTRSNQDLEQFAYVASHDLQEPLRMVRGHLGIVEERLAGKLDQSTRESMDFAVDGATRMQALINDLLEYSRLGRKSKGFSRTDMNAAVDYAIGNLSAVIGESGAAITHDSLPAVEAEPAMVPQLFQNLIGNAVKYRKAGVKPEIHIGAKRADRCWVFSVRDNGIGIRPEDSERVFMIFQRLHTRQQYPGTGIGLAICKRIVEHHCGRIWVESQLGQGSTFYFTIPDW